MKEDDNTLKVLWWYAIAFTVVMAVLMSWQPANAQGIDRVIRSKYQDKKTIFKGNDGGTEITGAEFDWADAGRFNVLGNMSFTNGTLPGFDFQSSDNGYITSRQSMFFYIDSDNNQTDRGFIWRKDGERLPDGTELMRLEESGKLGLGINTPTRRLHVHGTDGGFDSYIAITNGTTGSLIGDGARIGVGQGGSNLDIWNYESASINFGTANASRGQFRSGGDFVVSKSGSFTDAGSSYDIMAYDGLSGGVAGIKIAAGSAATGAGGLFAITAGGIGSNDEFRITNLKNSGTSGDSTARIYKNATEAAVIDSSGRWGLAGRTIDTGYSLTTGTVKIQSTTDTKFQLNDDGGGADAWSLNTNAANGFRLINITDSRTALAINEATSVFEFGNTVNTGGKTLRVISNSANRPTVEAVVGGGAGNRVYMNVGSTAELGTDDDIPLTLIRQADKVFEADANSLVYIRNDGSLSTATQTWCADNSTLNTLRPIRTCTSSRRYKEAIEDITEEESAKIYDLKPKSFTMKGSGEETYGFIAEEVHEVLPKLTPPKDADGNVETLNYRHMVALLVKELQKHQAKIEDLTARIEALEAQ
jgi:hypothetical protein